MVNGVTSGSTFDIPGNGLDALRAVRGRMADLGDTLSDINAIGGAATERQTRRIASAMLRFMPTVTVVGQIKSGKTTLVNALAGKTDLLPVDVNPWTSAVTSINLNARRRTGEPAARFELFDGDEWDRLVKNGGRMGELIGRAGAEKEMERLQAQIEKMRQATKARLGRKFELLLGQTHDYETFDTEILRRYICVGDDFDTGEGGSQQGQFADITKSANLYLDAPHIPIGMCLRDTPGVNDTFMMREQVTIKAIRDSELCVVVLSAHQALSTADLGLMRLISTLRDRQVVLFVNRIDELADPATQVEEIRQSIISTLSEHDLGYEPSIVFGSGYWANAALQGGMVDGAPPQGLDVLEALVGDVSTDLPWKLWAASGAPELFYEIGARIEEGAAARMQKDLRKKALNIVSGLRMSTEAVAVRSEDQGGPTIPMEELVPRLAQIEAAATEELKAELDKIFDTFVGSIDRANSRFIARAIEALIGHLEKVGEDVVWNYSPNGLRMLLRKAQFVMQRSFEASTAMVFEGAARRVGMLYAEALGAQAGDIVMAPASVPDLPPPVTLAQTIALDVKTSWWKSWWRGKKGYAAYAKSFHDLIAAEIAPIIETVRVQQVQEIQDAANARLKEFFSEQKLVAKDVASRGPEILAKGDDKSAMFELIVEELGVGDVTASAA